MAIVKRARARRNFKRKRSMSRRKRSATGLATKAYVQKQISRKQESKMVQFSDSFFYNSELNTYNDILLYKHSSTGTTDRGRIGNTIWATKINFKYKFSAEHNAPVPDRQDELFPQGLPPLYMNIMLIKRKNGTANIQNQFYKSKDRGVEFPYLPLTQPNVQNGLNALNTDIYTVVKFKKLKMLITRDQRVNTITGSMTHVFKKPVKITLNENSTNVVNNELVTPCYEIWMWPYWGTDSSWGGAWGFAYSAQQHYKD